MRRTVESTHDLPQRVPIRKRAGTACAPPWGASLMTALIAIAVCERVGVRDAP